MARKLGPKHTLCRRVGERLCNTDKCPVTKRPYPPGAHGNKKMRRQLSTYSQQFREKQKAKVIYGLMERQFRSTYEQAKRRQGNTGEVLIELLERRLDNVVFRLGFAKTRAQARQIVSHGLIAVGGKQVTIPSYRIRPGEVISFSTSGQKSKYLTDAQRVAITKYQAPSWLELKPEELSGRVLGMPVRDESMQNFDPTLVVEFYSR